MVEEKDIRSINVVCDSINFTIKRETPPVPRVKLELKINANWGLRAVKQDNKGLKFAVSYNINSTRLNGEIKITLTAEFNRVITQEEITSKDTYKLCVVQTVDYVINWTSDITSKMGISPVTLNPNIINDMIMNAK